MTFVSQAKSLAWEGVAALAAALAMKAFLTLSLLSVGIPVEGRTSVYINAYLVPFAFIILIAKTMFPQAVPHTRYHVVAYLVVSQALTALYAAVLLTGVGECWDCGGNGADVALYGLTVGGVYGTSYWISSKMFSRDVDTSVAGK